MPQTGLGYGGPNGFCTAATPGIRRRKSANFIHEQKGNKLNAIPALRTILSEYEMSQGVRTAIHFKIKDIYKEAGEHDKALKELKTILKMVHK